MPRGNSNQLVYIQKFRPTTGHRFFASTCLHLHISQHVPIPIMSSQPHGLLIVFQSGNVDTAASDECAIVSFSAVLSISRAHSVPLRLLCRSPSLSLLISLSLHALPSLCPSLRTCPSVAGNNCNLRAWAQTTSWQAGSC